MILTSDDHSFAISVTRQGPFDVATSLATAPQADPEAGEQADAPRAPNSLELARHEASAFPIGDAASSSKRFVFPALIVGLASLVVFSHGIFGLLNASDTDFPLDPVAELGRWAFTWDAQLNGGYANADVRLVTLSLFAALVRFGFGVGQVSHIYTAASFALFGLASYQLALKFPGPRRQPWAAFLGACAVTFSTSTLIYVQSSVNTVWSLAFSTLGLSFVVQIPGAKSKLPLYFMAAAGFAAASTDPYGLALNLGVAFCFLLIIEVWRRHWEGISKAITAWARLIALISALNAFWLFPMIVESRLAGSGIQSRAATESQDANGVAEYLSAYLQPYNLIRLTRGTDPGAAGETYDSLGTYAFEHSPVLVVSTLFLAGLSFVPMMRRRFSILILGLMGMAISGELLASGLRLPLGVVYTVLWQHVPGMSFFRDSRKFLWIAEPAVTVLLAMTANALRPAVPRWVFPRVLASWRGLSSASLLVATIVALGCCYAGFWQRNVAKNMTGVLVPLGYFDAAHWMEEPARDGRLLVLPAVSWMLNTTWDPTPQRGMVDPLFTLSPRPLRINVATYSLSPAMGQNQSWNELIARGDVGWAIRQMGRDGVSTIVVRRDLRSSEIDPRAIMALERALRGPNAAEYVELGPTFGELDFFNLKRQWVLPEITLRRTASSQEGANPSEPIEMQARFVRDGPTRYRIALRDVHVGDVAVLREAFNSGWTLSLRRVDPEAPGLGQAEPTRALVPIGDTFLKLSGYDVVPSSQHQPLVDDFNGWQFDRGGSFDGVIEFEPQIAAVWGWIVTVAAIIGGFAILVGASTRRGGTRRSPVAEAWTGGPKEVASHKTPYRSGTK